MFVEILFVLILGLLGLIWLLCPLLVFSLLSRTRRLEEQLRQLRLSVQVLWEQGGGEPASRRDASCDVVSRGAGTPTLRGFSAASRHEADLQTAGAVDAGSLSREKAAAATVEPPPAVPTHRPVSLFADRGDGRGDRPTAGVPVETPPAERREPSAAHREPARRGDEEHAADASVTARLWEEQIGGHWLNRIGGLLLAIGITLFVGYSIQQLGPRGRLALGAMVSLGLLGGGVFAQRWQAYRVFAASLVATGWAGLYITAYAAHGIPSAKIIEDPVVAMGVMVAVAAGMVGHTLFYRQPMATALAYLFGFVAIVISPVGPWSAAGCVLLAVSMLFVAFRFEWDQLAVAGLICTYGTLFLRGREIFEATPLWLGFTAGHAIVLICWLAFEGYDIVLLAKGPKLGAGRAILPMNFCCLLGAATGLWPLTVSPSVLSTSLAVVYGLSTFARLAVRRPSQFGEGSTPLDRCILGGYEATVAVAACATAVTIWQRFPEAPRWRLVLLMLEAESLFLLGFCFRQPFLRLLAMPFFAACFAALLQIAEGQHGRWSWGTLVPLRWVPHAVGMAGVFVVNRVVACWHDPQPQHRVDSLFSYAATGLLVACVVAEGTVGQLGLERYHLGMAGLLAAVVLLQLAIWADLDELFVQMQLVGTAAGLATFLMNGLLVGLPVGVTPMAAWGWLPPAAVVCGVLGWQLSRQLLHGRPLPVFEMSRSIAAGASIWLLLLFCWHLLPADAVAVAWMLMAMLVLAIGARLGEPSLRLQGHVMCCVVAGRLLTANFTTFGVTAGISHRVLTVVPIAAAFAFLAWSSPKQKAASPSAAAVERFMGAFAMHFATLALAVLLRFELGRVLTLPAWAGLGVVLLVAARRWASADLRLQAMVLAVVCFVRSWNTHFFIPEGILGVTGPVVIGAVVIVCLFASMMLSPRTAAAPPSGTGALVLGIRQGRVVYGVMATVLWAVLLYHEVPWRVITAAWGLEGAVLVVAGFGLRERTLRLAGLAVLGLCVPKLFFYDLRNLDTPARIVSFVLLGALLIAASWAYTRFRSQVRGLLEERER